MYRTNTCGELRISDKGKEVTLSGWVQRIRDKGSIIWVDLRDRYGIIQLVFDESVDSKELIEKVRGLGREYVITAVGKVIERESKNPNLPTGEIEIRVNFIKVLSKSDVPPFTIENNTDGGEEIRMKYRYLDLRRPVVREALELRNKISREIRQYLQTENFLEIETPYLIKSTPEGARDFVVPSRLNKGQFYALPQSPQTFKQLLMVAGYDKYFQIVRCFRDEDFRADRQPEFTQVDCEMSFVQQEDVIQTFEGLMKHLFKTVKGIDHNQAYPKISYKEAMEKYGSDKPDIRFGMQIIDLTEQAKGKGFVVFDKVEYIGGINITGCSEYSRKQLDELTRFVQKPQIGAKGMVFVKYNNDGTHKSSVDKFYNSDDFSKWAKLTKSLPGDLLLILAGDKEKTLAALGELRLEMAERLGLKDDHVYKPLWVVDFPLLEWDEETKRYYAKHHPFTSPKEEDIKWFESDPGKIRANAYDFVINGMEIGGGSIRIHDEQLQNKMFVALGFGKEEIQKQFGFLINAFRFGAPPHGGIAFGFDRLSAVFAGLSSIRDVIAFPKNNSGRDIMIDSPAEISETQMKELKLKFL